LLKDTILINVIVNESESEILKSNGAVIKFLLWTISMAMKAEEKSWDGWSLKELARSK
jgi:hypothetical protein